MNFVVSKSSSNKSIDPTTQRKKYQGAGTGHTSIYFLIYQLFIPLPEKTVYMKIRNEHGSQKKKKKIRLDSSLLT